MSQVSRCQALTEKGKGPQCLRNAEPGSIYCWQHRNYKAGTIVKRSPKANTSLYEHKNVQDIKEATVADPLFGKEYKASKPSPQGSYINMDEFKKLSEKYTATIKDDEYDSYKNPSARVIVAKGPITISLDIGEYESTIKHLLKLPKASYTYPEIIKEIKDVYAKKATHSDFFELIRLSDENEDESARELYAELQDMKNSGEDIRKYDFNGSNIFIEGIEYNTLLNEYYLILGS